MANSLTMDAVGISYYPARDTETSEMSSSSTPATDPPLPLLPQAHLGDHFGITDENLRLNSNTIQSVRSSPPSKFQQSSKQKKYKGKPSVIDEPRLVELCEHYTITRNITGLSMILRQKGLPPHLRHKIWPLLLRSHPFVLKPYITPDDVDDDDFDEVKIKLLIKHDLKKYFRKSRNHIDIQRKHQQLPEPTTESQELLKIEEEIIKVIQHLIWRFLKKWGSLINYDSGLTWILLGLAEWIPPLGNSDNDLKLNYVLCGREFRSNNGDTCLKNVNDELSEYLSYSVNNMDDDVFTNTSKLASSPLSSSVSSQLPIVQRLNLETNSEVSSLISVSTFTTNTSGFPALTQPQLYQEQQRPRVHSGSATPGNVSPGHKNMSFSEAYERMVLVILHSPEPTEDEEKEKESEKNDDDEEESPKEKILSTLPVKGGTPEERISFFLYCLRRLLPELLQFFQDEDILNVTSIQDDWIVWWLKWCGAKVWSKYDRGRLWDSLLGWRNKDTYLNKEELNDLLFDDDTIKLLGPDLFWHPLQLDHDGDFDDDRRLSNSSYSDIDDDDAKTVDRRGSIKTLISSLSNVNLSELSDTEGIDLPFSHLDPHTEILFISLSFIKSKEFALLELDQSEIREFLNKLSSLKLNGFQNLFEDEINHSSKNMEEDSKLMAHNNGSSSSVGLMSPQPEQHQQFTTSVSMSPLPQLSNKKWSKHGLREIENIIVESGELWRKWIWQEVSED